MRFLIDTDWAIHYLNDHLGVVQRLGELQAEGLALSLISLAELDEGIFYSRDPEGDEHALHHAYGLAKVAEQGLSMLGKESA